MNPERLAKLLETYRKLPAELQAVMNILAVHNGYCNMTLLGLCLSDLGFKDSKGKYPKTDTLTPYFATLQKARLTEQHPKQGTRRCLRGLSELIARQLVAADEFERYAGPIEKNAPYGSSYYRYNNIDDCLRDARIHFHRRDYAKVNECLEAGQRYAQMPYRPDIYLSWVINPLDAGWLSEQHPTLAAEMTGYIGLHQLLYLYADPAIDALLRQQSVEAMRFPFVRRLYAELLWLRGDWEAAAGLVTGSDDGESLAVAAALTFLQGDVNGAIDRFESALSLFRKQSGKRTDYFYGLAGVFYPLALLKSDDSARRAKLPTLLAQAAKVTGYWAAIYQQLSLFQQFLQGDLSVREALLRNGFPCKPGTGFNDNGEALTLSTPPLLLHVLDLFIKFWVKADHFNKVGVNEHKLYQHLVDNGYSWLAAELAGLFVRIEPGHAKRWDAGMPVQRAALVDWFQSRADWELALDALLNLNPAVGSAAETPQQPEKPTRLIWLLAYGEQDHSVGLEPREQKQQAKGGWSKGRAVALKRLHAERESFDYLTEADIKICRTLKEYRDTWYGNSFIDFNPKMPLALIGHPLLFWRDSPEVRVDVVKGEPELRVRKLDGGDKIHIALEPTPGADESLHIAKETPTRLKVVKFTDEHKKIATVLGAKGLEVPLSAQERVLQTLTGVSGMLTVHSDIGGSSGNAEQVEADSTPRVHLLPLGEGLRVALLMRPFATGGAYYQPGHGGESVLAEIDGKRLQAGRDLALEKNRAAAVLESCPALQDAERDAAGDWLLDDVEMSLELLIQLQTLPPDSVILEWPEGVRFKVLGQHSGTGFNLSIKRDRDWFAVEGELKVSEDSVVEIQQLLKLLAGGKGRFLQLENGQFIALTENFRRRLDDLKAYAELSGNKVRLNPLAALTLEDWQDDLGKLTVDKYWREHIGRLHSAREFQPVLPSTLQAELRDYQMDGYAWLSRLARWGVGACLADDMGLGKTVQGLALLLDRAPQGPSLIVAPTSVCLNWENEARRFAPTLNPQVLGAGDRQRLLDNLAPFDLLICSYGLLQQEQVADMLAQIRFQTVVLDEAQAIKNIATRRSQGAMNLQAEFKLIMTGTPLENHLGELWNLFRFINPGLLGSLEQFNQRYAVPIERDRSATARSQLKKLIQPFILRRTKTQVLQELPPRTEIPVYVELSSEEMAFYEALRRDSLANLSEAEDQPGQRHLKILAAITKLRRGVCNSRLANADINLPSSKLAAFGDIVDELLDNKHKALVFSQFVDHLQLIKGYVEQRGIPYQYLDGSTPVKERQQRVDAFQRGDDELFLISLKAGGVGLNLTAADYVIHMDPWWNPAVEDQASDRAHRMGQQRPVTIYRLIAKQTIEEKIVALHSHKRGLADSLLEGADISGKMSADDLLGLMRDEG